jgi:hypothetical protein
MPSRENENQFQRLNNIAEKLNGHYRFYPANEVIVAAPVDNIIA